ncbi:phosphate acyltransferase PlsX [Sandarakinorhabdus oryzae]|uniref:phosphate acyltransferase PlsX n=1 Tax=Sandarakinorhabdus oryzae TaxID=2675220 RepID=UPI0012E29062|nr:phosphate acyltransferase PlsX [Sandarakinorhabdus oryzae]
MTGTPNGGPVIALDVMSGDAGAAEAVAAADIAAERYPRLSFLLFGRQEVIAAELARWPHLAARARIVHSDDVVAMSDKPSQALRRARTTSMGLAIDAVKRGEANAAVSAGNTGALMAMSLFALRTMPGIDRPALAAVLPTLKSESVMLDLGANTECDATNLVQFAVMGAAFARTVLGLERPKVALLNIGEEELKGTGEIRAAATVLRGASLPMQFMGFVEGDKIGQGDTDVVVTDGFSGNIALKTAEGTSRLVTGLLGNAFRSSIWGKLGYFIARGALESLRAHLDPNAHNGAVFLGLNGLVVKSHGSANARGLANAIGVAHDLVIDDVGRRIRDDLAGVNMALATTLEPDAA